MKRLFFATLLGLLTILPSTSLAQEGGRRGFTPNVAWGIGFNADTNHPTFTGSLRLMAQLGLPTDILNINVGVGYRGFFDREPPVEFLVHPSFSDYMLYSRDDGHTKHVRPMGGQLVIPAELHLNLIPLSDETSLFIGCGVEYGVRLYQSGRYGKHYGAHALQPNSLGFYPMAGVMLDMEDGASGSLSLYWRHYAQRPLNGEEIDIDKFTAKDFFGFQLSVVL